MDSQEKKHELKNLIDDIRVATGLNQQEISLGAGYEARSLTQTLSSGKSIEATIKQLEIVYRHELNNSAIISSQKQDYQKIDIPESVKRAVEVLHEFVNQTHLKKTVKRKVAPDKTVPGGNESDNNAKKDKFGKGEIGKA